MSRLTDLIREAKRLNPNLGTELEKEVRHLQDRRAFGLNFERHAPEAVDLYGRPVRIGDKVRILPPRGEASSPDKRVWIVTGGGTVDGQRRADLTDPKTDDTAHHLVEDLVVVAENTDVIYPGLVSTGKVERGGDRPYHTVINGENLHVLEALLYTNRGKVDAVYIDPPYNSGARDWKYNNDYVEGEDLYRHSKWLAFMERRLRLAKELLNPKRSTLIVTIDEREMHRLGVLLHQVFPSAKVQMVTITINHRGVARNREFTRVEEYAFFLFFGDAGPSLTDDDLLTPQTDVPTARQQKVRWEWLIKGSNNAMRTDRPNLFYPVWVDPTRAAIVDIGDPIPLHSPRSDVAPRPGLVAVWPLSMDGLEKRWQNSASSLRQLVAEGYAKVGAYDRKNDRWSILYLNRGQRDRIARGEIRVTGRDSNGALEVEMAGTPARSAMTVWNRQRHAAGYYGSGILAAVIPNRKFPYPKSLYAVEDCLRFAVGDNPSAFVIDFFAGSGTSAHAVMRLNHQDGGARRCLLVTNNEVSADEQARLRSAGLRPGDEDWERWGICDYITKPRIAASITGKTAEGSPVKGDYKFIDEFPMADGFEENAEFFTLTYEAPLTVSTNHAFERVAPLLWLRAGARGRRIESIAQGWDVAESYGVIERLDGLDQFVDALRSRPDASVAFIITDDDRRFENACAALPDHVEAVRLYESYLRNFQIDAVRSSR